MVDTREGPHTSEWTRSKGVREEEILLLKGKAENFVGLVKASWSYRVVMTE